MRKHNDMIPLADALQAVDAALAEMALPTETVAVREALGRIVAIDQTSRVDLPPFDKSAMDGYALPEGDEGPTYQLIESVPAGAVPSKSLTAGTAIKVMTGAPVPAGTSKVVMIERTEERDGQVHVHTPDSAVNVCKQGEDVRIGDTIAGAGTVIDPAMVGVLIGGGVTAVEVVRLVRVAVLSTGDEIVDDPADLAPGKIMNSNGPMLAALVRQHGLDLVSEEAVGDDRAATAAAMARALEAADILVLSGGVSVGEFDVVADALGDRGMAIQFDRVAVKPGKPITFACAPGKCAFGLPGNPVSAFLMFHLFVLRTARLMSGLSGDVRAESRVLAGDFKRRKTQRAEYVPCRANADGTVEPIGYHGSADLRSVSACEGFFLVPVGVASLSAGQRVDVLTITGRLS
jgi:molybdopterin molybdotransferase